MDNIVLHKDEFGEFDGVIIQEVVMEDAERLLDIYAPYVLNTAVSFEYEVPSIEEFQNRIKNIKSRYPYIKAVDTRGKILGYAYAGVFKGRRAYDWSVESTIYLDESVKGHKIGSTLYKELEKRLQNMGILNMNACIALPRKEDEYLSFDSLRFHEKMGFTKVGIFHDSGYKFGKWYDMIWMEKMLGEHTKAPKTVIFNHD